MLSKLKKKKVQICVFRSGEKSVLIFLWCVLFSGFVVSQYVMSLRLHNTVWMESKGGKIDVDCGLVSAPTLQPGTFLDPFR